MEGMVPWKDVEDGEEVGLQRRQRQPRHLKNTITTATGNGSMDFKEPEGEVNGSLEKSVHKENNGVAGTALTVRSSEAHDSTAHFSPSTASTGEEDSDAKQKNVDIREILKSLIRDQDDETLKHELSSEEEYILFKLLNKGKGTKEVFNMNRLGETEEEEIELEFERAVEQLDQHRVHCPNCNSCITKVVLRKRKRVSPDPGFNLFGCLSCFSIFIPTGNGFNLFRIFQRPNGGGANEPNLHQTPELDENPSSNFPDERNTVTDERGSCFGLFRIFTTVPGKHSSDVTDEKDLQGTDHGQYQEKHEEAQYADKGLLDQDTQHLDKELPDQNGTPPTPQGSVSLSTSNNGVVPPDEYVSIIVDGKSDDNIIQKGAFSTKPVNQLGNIKSIGAKNLKGTNEPGTSQGAKEVTDPLERRTSTEINGSKTLEILKSTVYGGLMESITSLSIVSSAAAADATTVSIVAMGLANLIGGLFIMVPNLRELKNGQADRYRELLGQRENFLLHAMVAVLSFLFFGLIPPVAYGFSFRQSDDKDLKLVVVAAASLLCISLFAIAKAYINKPPKFYEYIKTVLYYVSMAVMASGISYAVGDLFKRLMEKLGWFDSSGAVALSLPQVGSVNPAWGYY